MNHKVCVLSQSILIFVRCAFFFARGFINFLNLLFNLSSGSIRQKFFLLATFTVILFFAHLLNPLIEVIISSAAIQHNVPPHTKNYFSPSLCAPWYTRSVKNKILTSFKYDFYDSIQHYSITKFPLCIEDVGGKISLEKMMSRQNHSAPDFFLLMCKKNVSNLCEKNEWRQIHQIRRYHQYKRYNVP